MKDNQFAVIPFEVLCSDLAPTSKVVYCFLSMLNNKQKGYCWPTDEQIYTNTCLSMKTVRTCLNELETKGYIRRETSYREEGFKKFRKIYLLQ